MRTPGWKVGPGPRVGRVFWKSGQTTFPTYPMDLESQRRDVPDELRHSETRHIRVVPTDESCKVKLKMQLRVQCEGPGMPGHGVQKPTWV